MTDSPLLGLLLLAVLAALPLLLRRMKAAQPNGVRVLSRTALHRNAVVAVVEIDGRRLLVGAGEKGIELLTELPAPADAAADEDAEVFLDLDALERMDVAPQDRTLPETDALEALLGPVGSSTTDAGPGIGLVDRLRAMTVRVSPPQGGAGRPIRVPLRR
ncbi:flagellar biosynthetic protein FliO [Egicoccus halophilus]|uniref:Flagellar protein n=1 Tax=Egicoccus halophilus TaxID=1670830 RepID=A0A8J3AAR7_9ACTN|nr:flagellar biosynthetic protein FliO [Egicoccus halophilus]GGI06721.1 hypothetical protein GCM10011354_20510 [Egicoccus halophilus]